MAIDLVDWAEKTLGHRFREEALLRRAMTHGSHGGADYERLEFLGDRVLGCIIAAWLFERFKDDSEGKLAVRFAALVDRSTCAEVGRAIGLPKLVLMDPAARQAGVNRSDNVLGDICEALIGALYVEGGMEAASRFVHAQWEPLLTTRTRAQKDPKSRLQEWAQGKGLPIPVYEVVRREGPDHQPRFIVRVTVRNQPPVEAIGASKQDAEKQAASAMLQEVGA